MDVIDLYDIDRQRTGRTTDQPRELGAGEFRLVIHLCVFNSRGEMLIARRQDSTDRWPGLWDVTVSGCAVAGETGRQAAMREAREELGLLLNLEGLRPALTVSFSKGYDEVFLVNAEPDPAGLVLQREEVAEVRWASLDEIIALRNAGRFTPMLPEYLKTLFRIRELGDVMEE